MFACICRAVTDDDVRAAVDRGATTVKAVACQTRAGTGCGTCQSWLKTLIEERSECPAGDLQVA
ncbi:MAG TPA: (2Fe-2S)-binding protein [Streptosporangiaceae bacterium]